MKTPLKYRPLVMMMKAMARLPLGALYVLADFLAVVLHYVARYRLKVVRKNISESFPEKSEAELRQIVRDFYRNMADYVVETIKLFHISDEEMERRMTFENVELVDSLMSQGRSIVAYFSHCGNWEWVPSITRWSRLAGEANVAFCQVYRPLKNKVFDEMFLHLRSRFGSLSFQKSRTLRELITLRRDGVASITGFMSDQKPSHGDTVHVVKFLNHPTAVITGTEMLARKLDFAVVYFDMFKESRGHYKVKVRLITDDIKSMPDYSVTDRYVRLLEDTIRRRPAIWLWSHKRWKHPVKYEDDETRKE